MPSRVFNENERNEIREKLLEVGFPMLKEYGMIHMSIPKIAQAAGIGTGTFYRFFPSKEEYVYAMIEHRRQILLTEAIPADVREGRRKLTKDEVRELIRMIIDKDRSVYANLSLEDESRLLGSIDSLAPNVEREQLKSKGLLSLIEDSREHIDFPVLANLLKILAITSQAREELHAEGYERTIEVLIDSIIREIYE